VVVVLKSFTAFPDASGQARMTNRCTEKEILRCAQDDSLLALKDRGERKAASPPFFPLLIMSGTYDILSDSEESHIGKNVDYH
jgi:hypothetical protein